MTQCVTQLRNFVIRTAKSRAKESKRNCCKSALASSQEEVLISANGRDNAIMTHNGNYCRAPYFADPCNFPLKEASLDGAAAFATQRAEMTFGILLFPINSSKFLYKLST